ncbi:hypothetical protein [Sedimentibacter sp.]|uniref:hypothetical protein n=1 Tax=Sedimentibacter sp. TaxID=1960295 RepID=UPI0028AA183E|nr:hypothetical protein [Sedimentibacter sp.]
MALDMRVSLHPKQAAEIVNNEIVNGSVTGELIDSYVINGDNDKLCVISVYDKHYYRPATD